MKLLHVRKRVAAVIVCMICCYAAALSLTHSWVEITSARLAQETDDNEILFDAFQKEKGINASNRDLMETYHKKGSQTASMLLMMADEKEGDLKGRDKVFLEALGLAGNAEVWGLLRQSQSYSPEERAKALEWAQDPKMTQGGKDRDRLVASGTTTLTEPQQMALQTCKKMLDARYEGFLWKAYYFYDLMYRPKSCQMPAP